jgi:hypothetical protein
MEMQDMTDDEYARKLDEIDRHLNDPDVPMLPGLIWRLVNEVSQHDLQVGTAEAAARGGPFCWHRV